MNCYILKNIPSSQSSREAALKLACVKNYKHFRSVTVDKDVNKRLRTQIKSTQKLVFGMHELSNSQTKLFGNNALRRSHNLTITDHQETNVKKESTRSLIRNMKNIKTLALNINIASESSPQDICHHPSTISNLVKYFRLDDLSLGLIGYGKEFDFQLENSQRRTIFKKAMQAVARQTHLRTLRVDFSEYKIESKYSFELDCITHILPRLSHLSTLDLGQSIGSVEWNIQSTQKLIDTVKLHPNISDLSLIFDEENTEIFPSLTSIMVHPSLENLKLTFNISKDISKKLKDISKFTKTIKSLYLELNSRAQDKNFWLMASEWLRSLQRLESLSIQYRKSADPKVDHIRYFAESLCYMNAAKKIHLDCLIERNSSSFINLILESTAKAQSLTQLSLEGFNFDTKCNDKDFNHLFQRIKLNSKCLTGVSLELGQNKMTEKSLQYLQSALQDSHQLKKLSLILRLASLQDSGLEALSKIIKGCKQLKHVSLNFKGNTVTKQPINSLVNSLVGSKHIEDLKLVVIDPSSIRKEEAKQLKTSTKISSKGKNWSIELIDLISQEMNAISQHKTSFYKKINTAYYVLQSVISRGLWRP